MSDYYYGLYDPIHIGTVCHGLSFHLFASFLSGPLGGIRTKALGLISLLPKFVSMVTYLSCNKVGILGSTPWIPFISLVL